MPPVLTWLALTLTLCAAEPASVQPAESASEQRAAPASEQPAEPASERRAEPVSVQPAEAASEQQPGPASLDSDADLRRLRAAAAARGAEVLPRLELAKALHDRGDRLLAFAVAQQVAEEGHDDYRRLFHHVFRGGPAELTESAERSLRERAAAAPEDVRPLKELADILLWRSDFAGAAEVLERAAKLAPEDFSVHANLAQSLQAIGEVGRAGEVLESWFRGHEDSEQAIAHRVQQLLGRDGAAARSLLEEGLRTRPEAGSLHGLEAMLLQQEGRGAEAEAALRRAASFSDDNPGLHLALGALDAERDPARAREHYLSAFFLDPFAGLEAPAATRIKELTYVLGTERFDETAKSCAELACFTRLIEDENPVVVTLALKGAELNWRPWHAEPLVRLLSTEDPDLRGKAASVLRRHADESFLPRLRELLVSENLHARGLAGFLAVKLMGAESLPVLEGFLASPVQVLRRDAIRALGSSGLDGSLEILEGHLHREQHPRLLEETRAVLAHARPALR